MSFFTFEVLNPRFDLLAFPNRTALEILDRTWEVVISHPPIADGLFCDFRESGDLGNSKEIV
jgi:hypothetical protein